MIIKEDRRSKSEMKVWTLINQGLRQNNNDNIKKTELKKSDDQIANVMIRQFFYVTKTKSTCLK